MQNLEQLHQEFKIKWMVQSGYKNNTKCICVAYFDARDTMNVLNNVLGLDGWQDKIETVAGKTVCSIGVKVNGEWIFRADMGDTIDGNERSTASTAFKRAGVKRGIGKFTYDLPNVYMDYVKEGKRGYAIQDGKKLKPEELSDICNKKLRLNNIKSGDIKFDKPITATDAKKAREAMEKGEKHKAKLRISKDQEGIIMELLQYVEPKMDKPEDYDQAERYIKELKKYFRMGIEDGSFTPDANYIKKIFGKEAKDVLDSLPNK